MRVVYSILAAAMAGLSAPAHAETLTDALALAYQTNPTIRAERARLRAIRESKAQAWAGALPQVSAQGSYQKVDQTVTSLFNVDPNDPNPMPQSQDTNFEPLTGAVNAEQAIFTGFRNYNAIKQAGARVRAGGAQLAGAEQQVLLDVASAYFNVQRNMAVFELNKNNVTVLVRQQDMAKARFDVGEITRTDVSQADARLAEARARLSSAQGELAIARAQYGELVGQVPGDLEPVETLPELPDTLEGALAIAAQYAPANIAAREQAEVSRRQVNIARGAFLPSVSVTAGYQYAEEPSFFVNNSEEFSFGARASMPIFLGGLNFSRVREAKALHDSDRSQAVAAARQVEARTIAAWERLVAARAVARSAAASVEANTMALEGVRQEAQVGTRTTLDVLNAEQEYLNAQVTLVSAQRDMQTAAFGLLAAIGMLTPEGAGVSNEALEAAAGEFYEE
ncbi:TolC family outer membrane protein [Hyphococcus sp.]|uniref:TolC family outer membrane protein n=1 Tax=Hyphococcus sp. TaxID=2038636 RepID=UPI0035C675E0